MKKALILIVMLMVTGSYALAEMSQSGGILRRHSLAEIAGFDTMAITTVEVSTVAPTELISSRVKRKGFLILNNSGAAISLSTVNSTQTATQFPLANDAEFKDFLTPYTGAVYGLATATGTVKIIEKY